MKKETPKRKFIPLSSLPALGISKQTILWKINNKKDDIQGHYLQRLNKKTRTKRTYISEWYIHNYLRENTPPTKEVSDAITARYYVLYDLIENKLLPDDKNKEDSGKILKNMSLIDILIGKYIIEKYEKRGVLDKKKIAKSLKTLSFRSRKDAENILKYIDAYILEIMKMED